MRADINAERWIAASEGVSLGAGSQSGLDLLVQLPDRLLVRADIEIKRMVAVVASEITFVSEKLRDAVGVMHGVIAHGAKQMEALGVGWPVLIQQVGLRVEALDAGSARELGLSVIGVEHLLHSADGIQGDIDQTKFTLSSCRRERDWVMRYARDDIVLRDGGDRRSSERPPGSAVFETGWIANQPGGSISRIEPHASALIHKRVGEGAQSGIGPGSGISGELNVPIDNQS